MHPARRPLARTGTVRRCAASGVLLGAGALLLLGAASSQAAVGDAKATQSSSADAGVDAGLGADAGYEADTVASTSLPAGGLAVALVLAGAGTVLATRAMCSGRGWR